MWDIKINKDGKVDILLRAGNDLVQNELEPDVVRGLIKNGDLVKSDIAGYPICVDNTWYIKGVRVKKGK